MSPALRLASLAGAFALMVALSWFNAQPVAAGLIPAPWDKAAHFAVFATLSVALALGAWPRLWPVALAVAAFAAFDELRQLDSPGRSADWGDFFTDLGAMAFVLGWAAALRARVMRVTGPPPGRGI